LRKHIRIESEIAAVGKPQSHDPVLLVMAVFSRHDEARKWARQKAIESWGPIALSSEPFAFDQTDYYDSTMGADLKKEFWAFERLIDPTRLVELKLQANEWEIEYATAGRHVETRPLNLDPGYLTLGKLVLASTKDYAHRIYLGQGIFAEITLRYRHHRWEHHEFTFPDYRRTDYQAFFSQCREYLKRAKAAG
jgi:hypothetical protein